MTFFQYAKEESKDWVNDLLSVCKRRIMQLNECCSAREGEGERDDYTPLEQQYESAAIYEGHDASTRR